MEITFYRKLANKLADKVIENDTYTETQAKKIRYGLVCIFSDLYKFILFLIIFAIFSSTKEFLLSFLCILLLRPYLGGFHSKNEFVCILISFLTSLISVLAGKADLIPYYIQIALIIALPATGAIISPVRPNKEKNSYTLLKALTFIFTALLLLLDFFVIEHQFLFVSVILVYSFAVYPLLKNAIKIAKYHNKIKITN